MCSRAKDTLCPRGKTYETELPLSVGRGNQSETRKKKDVPRSCHIGIEAETSTGLHWLPNSPRDSDAVRIVGDREGLTSLDWIDLTEADQVRVSPAKKEVFGTWKENIGAPGKRVGDLEEPE